MAVRAIIEPFKIKTVEAISRHFTARLGPG
jgi:hypothetical protein